MPRGRVRRGWQSPWKTIGVPARYESRLFTISPTATGYETRMAPGGDQKIGVYTLLVGVFGAVIGLFFSGLVRIAIVVIGVLLVLLGVAALIQSARSKVRALTTLDKNSRTITQGPTILPITGVSGIGLIAIKSFLVVGVHRTEGKPLWLSSAAKMPRQVELEAAVEAMAEVMSVPYVPLPEAAR